MHLSTKGRYAVMAMLDLAKMQEEDMRPVTLMEISQNQQISLSYLEQLFANLRRAGLVKSMRGPGGGYLIARAAGEISVFDVVEAVREKVDVTSCGTKIMPRGKTKQGCRPDHSQCNAHHLWAALTEHIESFLKQISLADVLRNKFTSDIIVKIQEIEAPLTDAEEQRLSV